MGLSASTTRRELIGRVGALAGLGAAGGTVAALLGPAPAPAQAQAESDADALRALSAVELLGVFMYERAIQSRVLSAGTEHLTRKLLGHEQAHARALELELGAHGLLPPANPAGPSEADRALSRLHVSGSLTGVPTEHNWLELLLGYEAAAGAAYYEAASKLSDPALLRIAAESMACEAQHATLLSQALNRGDVTKAVPDAFVEGKR